MAEWAIVQFKYGMETWNEPGDSVIEFGNGTKIYSEIAGYFGLEIWNRNIG